jgi:hypothetical protein
MTPRVLSFAAKDRGAFDLDTGANQHLSEGLCHLFRDGISTPRGAGGNTNRLCMFLSWG